jgi:hypothetical protein
MKKENTIMIPVMWKSTPDIAIMRPWLFLGVLNERAEPEPRLFGLGSFNI